MPRFRLSLCFLAFGVTLFLGSVGLAFHEGPFFYSACSIADILEYGQQRVLSRPQIYRMIENSTLIEELFEIRQSEKTQEVLPRDFRDWEALKELLIERNVSLTSFLAAIRLARSQQASLLSILLEQTAPKPEEPKPKNNAVAAYRKEFATEREAEEFLEEVRRVAERRFGAGLQVSVPSRVLIQNRLGAAFFTARTETRRFCSEGQNVGQVELKAIMGIKEWALAQGGAESVPGIVRNALVGRVLTRDSKLRRVPAEQSVHSFFLYWVTSNQLGYFSDKQN